MEVVRLDSALAHTQLAISHLICQAYGLGLLDLSALHRVASTARCDFLRIWARYGHRASGGLGLVSCILCWGLYVVGPELLTLKMIAALHSQRNCTREC